MALCVWGGTYKVLCKLEASTPEYYSCVGGLKIWALLCSVRWIAVMTLQEVPLPR